LISDFIRDLYGFEFLAREQIPIPNTTQSIPAAAKARNFQVNSPVVPLLQDEALEIVHAYGICADFAATGFLSCLDLSFVVQNSAFTAIQRSYPAYATGYIMGIAGVTVTPQLEDPVLGMEPVAGTPFGLSGGVGFSVIADIANSDGAAAHIANIFGVVILHRWKISSKSPFR